MTGPSSVCRATRSNAWRVSSMWVLLMLSSLAVRAETSYYRLESPGTARASVVTEFRWSRDRPNAENALLYLEARKASGGRFRVWIRNANRGRLTPVRYILQEGDQPPREYRDALGGVLTPRAFAQPLTPQTTVQGAEYLGHRYSLHSKSSDPPPPIPEDAVLVTQRPDLLIGPAHNTRPVDDRRRWDDSDYELRLLTREEYRELAEAGVTCVNVDAEQAAWAEELGIYYWGAAATLPYPEMLYRSLYLGGALFLDEPAVGTRDHVIRPRLGKDQDFRKSLQPEIVLEAFRKHFQETAHRVAHATHKTLAARQDVDLGNMQLVQTNLYTWETMPASAIHQLTQGPYSPAAFVFEPPGRIGTQRTVPEMNMTYGTQLAQDDPRSLLSVIYGFLRGAARLGRKEWGVSIYGAVQRNDAPFWLTHAYDLGATHFFFWDTYKLALVPYREVLALARHLRNHADANPRTHLAALRNAGEVAILLPPGYDLGHVFMGKGLLWGLPELNLERVNKQGVKYRSVMSNFFLEIERCQRSGVPFDLFWDLPGMRYEGYREVVRVRTDGKVEVSDGPRRTLLAGARKTDRAPGVAPALSVALEAKEGAALEMTATATVSSPTSTIYFTTGADPSGVYHNAMVAWELYGPEPVDYRYLQGPSVKPHVNGDSSGALVYLKFTVDRPGKYRLRAATVDRVGRSRVVWVPFSVVSGPGGPHLQLSREPR